VALIGIRRGLVDSVIDILKACELFNKKSVFPHRYFDDMVLES
jgi:hypothetical protein